MSDNGNQDPFNSDQWEEMLRAVMGDDAAERMIEQMRTSGIDPSASMGQLENLDFSLVINQVRNMLGSAGEGPVNWKVGEQIAREEIQRKHYDSLSAADAQKARDALSAASLWLDPAVALGPITGPTQAWSRLDWLAHSLPTFKRLTDPVAENIARAFVSALSEHMNEMPEEMTSMLGGLEVGSMFRNLMASVTAIQFGKALAELASVVFGSSDAALPLVEGHTAALIPSNVAAFAQGLDSPEDEVRMYVAIREQATARLFSHIPWLRPRLLDTVAAYARDIEIDTEEIERQVRESGMDPQKLQEFEVGDAFTTRLSESQTHAIEQLQYLLSLIEGWVSAVSLQVAVAQLPHAVALSEMFNRRASTGSPAQRVFGPLVGLEIKPRKNREAQRFWEIAYAKLGIDGRDAIWNHPDLLPFPEHLTNPNEFFDMQAKSSAVEEEIDSFLAEILSSAESADSEATPSAETNSLSHDSHGESQTTHEADERDEKEEKENSSE